MTHLHEVPFEQFMPIPAHIQELDAPPGSKAWLVHLDQRPCEAELNWLSTAEHERAATFYWQRDARRYQVSRVALRRILSNLLYLEPARVRYSPNAHGQCRQATGGVHFHVCQADDWALIGISEARPVGVAIEMLKPLRDASLLIKQHFTEEEQGAWLTSPLAHRDSHFLRCWTRKEACLKAVGSGLAIATHVFEVGHHSQPARVDIFRNGQRYGVDVNSVALPVSAVAAIAQCTEGASKVH